MTTRTPYLLLRPSLYPSLNGPYRIRSVRLEGTVGLTIRGWTRLGSIGDRFRDIRSVPVSPQESQRLPESTIVTDGSRKRLLLHFFDDSHVFLTLGLPGPVPPVRPPPPTMSYSKGRPGIFD